MGDVGASLPVGFPDKQHRAGQEWAACLQVVEERENACRRVVVCFGHDVIRDQLEPG